MASLASIRIESIAHGGDGVGAGADGKRVFVPLVAPGDLVEVGIVEDRGRHARGEIARLIEAGPGRVDPACRHFGACGGCQLQHLTEAAQLQAKEGSFYEALARLGDLQRESIVDPRPIAPSPRAFGYRIRCKVRVRGRQAGYLRRRSDSLEPLEECGLLDPALEALALRVVARVREKPLRHLASVDLCVGDDGAGAGFLEPEPGAPAGWEAEARTWLSIEGLRGLIAAPGGRDPRRSRAAPPGVARASTVFGDPVVSRPAPHAPGVRLLGRPDVFAQANAAANEALVGLAVEALEIRPGDEVLELYCGAGNFTYALAARGAKVAAVETEGASLALARRALAESKSRSAACTTLDGRGHASDRGGSGGTVGSGPGSMDAAGPVRFIAGDAGLVAEGFAKEGRRFDHVLLDPPRSGAKGLAESLARIGPRRIAYVSCDPPTLARDAKALRSFGYRPILACPVDMFPQTFHVEGVVVFERI